MRAPCMYTFYLHILILSPFIYTFTISEAACRREVYDKGIRSLRQCGYHS